MGRDDRQPARDASAFMASCTPSRLNFEGNPSAAEPTQRRPTAVATATSTAGRPCSRNGARAATSRGWSSTNRTRGHEHATSSGGDGWRSRDRRRDCRGLGPQRRVRRHPRPDGRGRRVGSRSTHPTPSRRRRNGSLRPEERPTRRTRRSPTKSRSRRCSRTGRRVRLSRRGGERRRHHPPVGVRLRR